MEARAQNAAHLVSVWFDAQLMEVHNLLSSKIHQTPQNVSWKQLAFALNWFCDE